MEGLARNTSMARQEEASWERLWCTASGVVATPNTNTTGTCPRYSLWGRRLNGEERDKEEEEVEKRRKIMRREQKEETGEQRKERI